MRLMFFPVYRVSDSVRDCGRGVLWRPLEEAQREAAVADEPVGSAGGEYAAQLTVNISL